MLCILSSTPARLSLLVTMESNKLIFSFLVAEEQIYVIFTCISFVRSKHSKNLYSYVASDIMNPDSEKKLSLSEAGRVT